MTKDELKKEIMDMKLDGELENLIFELIDAAPEVDQELLQTVAGVLDLEADVLDKKAEIFDEQADLLEDFAAELEAIDEEEYKAQIDAIQENQETLLADLNKKIAELSAQQPVGTASTPAAPAGQPQGSQPTQATPVDDIRKTLEQHMQNG